MMNVRAWSEARPAYEAAQEKNHIISEVRQVESREREQGMSIPLILGALTIHPVLKLFEVIHALILCYLESIRQRLVGFVASVKSALDDLQG